MKTKQEAIKQAYGEHWDKVCEHVDKDGYCHAYFGIQMQELQGIGKPKNEPLKWRPKSLEGLEDNNGWIKLNGLPNEITNRCSMWIMTKNGIEYLKENEFLPIGYASHYKPIEKPKPPIY